MARMRKAAIILTVALAAMVGSLVRGVPLAHASSCGGQTYYDGWLWIDFPPVGTTEGLYIDLKNYTRYSGSIRGYIQYTNSLGDTLTTGILNTGDGPQAYIEYDGVFEGKWSVSSNTSYHFWITHDSTADFTAHVGGFGSYQAIVHSSSTYNPTIHIRSTSVSSSGTCNLYTYDFSGLEPENTSDFNAGGPFYDLPYQINDISATE